MFVTPAREPRNVMPSPFGVQRSGVSGAANGGRSNSFTGSPPFGPSTASFHTGAAVSAAYQHAMRPSPATAGRIVRRFVILTGVPPATGILYTLNIAFGSLW